MTPYYQTKDGTIYQGDALEVLNQMEPESIQTCITSPPYWGLRDYGVEGQLGLEPTPEEYVAKMVEIFRGVRRVLRKNGTLWLNLGDSYSSGGRKSYDPDRVSKSSGLTNNSAGIDRKTPAWAKPKDLCGIPWRVAFALQADGWWLRQDIIWAKPNPMPESVTDRCTKAHEYIFLLSKSGRYYYDADAVRVKGPGSKTWGAKHNQNDPYEKQYGNRVKVVDNPLGANKRSVWTVTTKPFPEAHFATFPPALIEPCVLAGCPEGGNVLDPFFGSGTTGLVAYKHNRRFVGIELNSEYCEMAKARIDRETKQSRLFN